MNRSSCLTRGMGETAPCGKGSEKLIYASPAAYFERHADMQRYLRFCGMLRRAALQTSNSNQLGTGRRIVTATCGKRRQGTSEDYSHATGS